MFTPNASELNGQQDIKVYISTVTGNAEIRQQIRQILMVLDGMGVPFQQVDITVRGNEMERDFMRERAINPRNGTDVPLPPQIFYKFEYLGTRGIFTFITPEEEDVADDEEEDEEESVSDESGEYDESDEDEELENEDEGEMEYSEELNGEVEVPKKKIKESNEENDKGGEKEKNKKEIGKTKMDEKKIEDNKKSSQENGIEPRKKISNKENEDIKKMLRRMKKRKF
uniref:Uncharacterized protein n=1 Tax=Meloidogyne enterolobii TaxID=390850 RepID=A0A6V7XAX8_MELEN|nr:unnamed protein product [Meloidogyne enterolobii]